MKSGPATTLACLILVCGFAMGFTYRDEQGGGSGGGERVPEPVLTTEQEFGRWIGGELTKPLAKALAAAAAKETSEAADAEFARLAESEMKKWFRTVSDQVADREENGANVPEVLREWAIGMEAVH